MGDRFKFRAWNLLTHEMGEVAALTQEWQTKYTLVKLKQDELALAVFTDHLIIMQWTGLRDKNGKEVYEGDIVKTPLYGQRICEVIFNETKAAFYLLMDTGMGTNIYPMGDVTMEVIGNIFEKALLTESEKV